MIELDPILNMAPEKILHIHIMGICGTGMAALAGMLKASGYRVTGSDSGVYPPMSDFLEGQGIQAASGYGPQNLLPRPDLVIVGNVITRKNPEAHGLADAAIPYLSFPQALAHFFIRSRTSLVVAGTHGKTTTSSLLASALHRAGLDPSFMIGGIVREFDANFRLGNGPHFVVEGDEYDTAFFDKGSKFLHYRPNIAIITSVEFDHADIFADLDAIKSSFRKFVVKLPADGLIVAHLDDPNVAEVVADAPCEVQGYGFSPDLTWSLADVRAEQGMTRFQVHHQGEPWAEMAVRMPGRHNSLNSLAVTAVLHRIGLAPEQINNALSRFGGVKRRQEVRGIEAGITVIDDFAHHPTAVRETLGALKDAYAGQRLVTIFEPRTNSSRRSIFQQDYVSAFDASDLILIRKPLPLANVPEADLFSSSQLASDLRARGLDARTFADTDTILDHLMTTLQKGDVVAILSNGGFDNIHSRLLEKLGTGTK
ncbi:MAG: UDP-N-acetylmuramate:L-alanyl-gamma-D-glutamyl-meso-diaminopimelate ligase [Proteobacteria bacterium]|jgi:UDP-N-acetylmuramate: L-alanyl-gamma-D-glutamyl-meso-diaminopimelate ligase|nr:UDP-N-acetylmuramate:L-alanyl-gamma-D-glutamyl-meso-diaminopimelate ligase [Pseudomonadota bacterium]MCG2743963.1 UDP-N-acetylmuramate:L-alanyl-gamma-D-glutamyl-meso-diaminopimelate ligase [Desulfobacteraceae bacterium]MBU4029751.1 UDP-N-acetylmuramate:L-alanyl-gamma-D-glutamyl-meso-diaminopimelate ligase [Pseudomonadota bacterium]MBU4043401.1 UDP-N-acetylmuramate:L-alanyl-gamma-D-glutamyl-meso-diaminopimelate ligase [Pseudomonadota bacterium]MBU4084959.1 UDP-N-acetylmuramate:L-alanyl-gamma-